MYEDVNNFYVLFFKLHYDDQISVDEVEGTCSVHTEMSNV
jgi:hypothetical protein